MTQNGAAAVVNVCVLQMYSTLWHAPKSSKLYSLSPIIAYVHTHASLQNSLCYEHWICACVCVYICAHLSTTCTLSNCVHTYTKSLHLCRIVIIAEVEWGRGHPLFPTAGFSHALHGNPNILLRQQFHGGGEGNSAVLPRGGRAELPVEGYEWEGDDRAEN